MGQPCAAGEDGIDGLGRDAGVAQRVADGPARDIDVRGRLPVAGRAGGLGLAGDLGVDARAALRRQLPVFQHQHGRALAQHHAATARVERPLRGGIIARVQQPDRLVRAPGGFAQRIGPARQRRVHDARADHSRSGADRGQAGRRPCLHRERRPGDAQPHRRRGQPGRERGPALAAWVSGADHRADRERVFLVERDAGVADCLDRRVQRHHRRPVQALQQPFGHAGRRRVIRDHARGGRAPGVERVQRRRADAALEQRGPVVGRGRAGRRDCADARDHDPSRARVFSRHHHRCTAPPALPALGDPDRIRGLALSP